MNAPQKDAFLKEVKDEFHGSPVQKRRQAVDKAEKKTSDLGPRTSDRGPRTTLPVIHFQFLSLSPFQSLTVSISHS